MLAIVFLNERLTWPRMAFVVAGLAGMLMIVQPGAELFKSASLLALASAACYAVYQITTRMLAAEDPRVTLFYPALIGTLLMTFVWPWFGSRHRRCPGRDVAMLAVHWRAWYSGPLSFSSLPFSGHRHRHSHPLPICRSCSQQ